MIRGIDVTCNVLFELALILLGAYSIAYGDLIIICKSYRVVDIGLGLYFFLNDV